MPDVASSFGAFGDEVSDIGDLFDLITARPAWQASAACRSMPPEMFFPLHGTTAEAARLVCARCPVTAACLDFALDLGAEAVGVWGGTVPAERRQMRRGAA